MPLTEQNDVCNSGIKQGSPQVYAGVTCSVLPTGKAMAQRGQSMWVPSYVSASGLNQRYANRFDDPTFYSS